MYSIIFPTPAGHPCPNSPCFIWSPTIKHSSIPFGHLSIPENSLSFFKEFKKTCCPDFPAIHLFDFSFYFLHKNLPYSLHQHLNPFLLFLPYKTQNPIESKPATRPSTYSIEFSFSYTTNLLYPSLLLVKVEGWEWWPLCLFTYYRSRCTPIVWE